MDAIDVEHVRDWFDTMSDRSGNLLSHRRHRTTASFAQLANNHLIEAAEQIGTIIA